MARWRLKPGFDHRGPDGKELRGGDVLEMPRSRMEPLLDRFDPLEDDSPEEEAKPPETKLKVHARGGGWWDVINQETGKPINSKPLRAGAARALAGESDDD